MTDQEKVENLLSEKPLTCEYDLRNGTLRFEGVSGFTVYEDRNGTWQKYGGLGSLLHELRPFLEEGEELIIQSVRGDAHNFPIGAYQFKATPEAVHYSDLDTDEKVVEVQPSSE